MEAEIVPSALGPGELGRLDVEIRIPEGWHLWSLDPGPGPKALSLSLDPNTPVDFEGPWHGDAPAPKFDRGFDRSLLQYEAKQIRLSRRVRVRSHAQPTEHAARLRVEGQICTDRQCVDQSLTVILPLVVAAGPTNAEAPVMRGAALAMPRAGGPGAGLPGGAVAAVAPAAPAGGSLAEARSGGLWSFLALAFVFGLGALATPCVFPAIPLTVSFFSKYSSESFGRGARLALVYALTMVAAFTAGGVLVSIIFGVTGITQFAAHPVFNVFLGLTLVFFSLNLLGLFEIRTPSFLLSGVNALERRFGRGAALGGAAKSGGLSDYLVVSVAALTATTVFFTCTVAFVGLVLVEAAKGEWVWPTLGMLAFASAFALPFFLLALFPQAAHRLRGKSGSWLSATRVTLGFLELAAATKFLSNADLVWKWNLLTRDLVLAFWVPIFALAGLFLLGKLKIGHEHAADEGGGVNAIQMLVAASMFALSLYLGVGLVNQRSFGGWIDGWLPPVSYPGGMAVEGRSGGVKLAWIYDLEEGRRKARAEGKAVFVNYTGYTCTNCRYMEGGVFPRPEIASILETMVLVELYTDGGTPDNDANRADQVARFQTAALPLYSVEKADGTILGVFPSSTNDVEEFRQFLLGARAKAAEPAKIAAAPGAQDVQGGLRLVTTRLTDRQPEPALVPGKWSLINYWATWCGPCREELKDFLAEAGRDFETRGHRFAAVAMESEENLAEARAFMEQVKVPAASSLLVLDDHAEEAIDPRIYPSSGLPYSVLVSPQGEVVWSKGGALKESELRAVLLEHTGHAAK